MTAAASQTRRPAWHDQVLSCADAARVRAGLDELLVVAPFAAFRPDPAFVGGVVRDDVGHTDACADLTAALGRERLERMCVAYVGCFAQTKDTDGLASEISTLVGAAGQVIVVEVESATEQGHIMIPAGPAELRAAGVTCREHRLAPDITDLVVRLTLCGAPRRPGGPSLDVAISDHHGKSVAFEELLIDAGHRLVEFADLADLVLIDHDVPFHGRLPLVEACVDRGGRAFLYPHGADAALMSGWDGLYPICPLLSGTLVTAPGHVQLARSYGYPIPMHVVGWPFCELAPRRQTPVKKVLFAPTHPPYMGHPRYPDRNTEVLRQLLSCPVDLTVRYLGDFEDNGLFPASNVTFVCGTEPGAPGMVEQIDAADCVVADRGTFGSMAIARGVTTVLWDTAILVDNQGITEPTHVERYRELVRYPFDVDNGDLWDTITAAARDTDQVAAWRELFIGEQLDIHLLLDALTIR